MNISIRGETFLVSRQDFSLISNMTWRLKRKKHYIYALKSVKATIPMHRIIMELKLNRKLTRQESVDHINGNTLDNRRSNLRLASNKENARNSRKSAKNTTGYKGVYKVFGSEEKPWKAAIYVNGKSVHLGCFANLTQAAKAYDQAAILYFGKFAKLNFEE